MNPLIYQPEVKYDFSSIHHEFKVMYVIINGALRFWRSEDDDRRIRSTWDECYYDLDGCKSNFRSHCDMTRI